MARRKIRLDPAIRVKPEGEPAFTTGLRAFIAANRDAFTLSEVKRMRKAARGGEEVCLGGGAASAFCITRIGKKSSLGGYSRRRGFGSTTEIHNDRAGTYERAYLKQVGIAKARATSGDCDQALTSLMGTEHHLGKLMAHVDSGGKDSGQWANALDHEMPKIKELFRRRCMVRR